MEIQKSDKYDSRPIGFFDSGIGGLSVYSSFMNKLSTENTIYLADIKNLPYGNKTPAQLINLARNIFDFFSRENVKAVVIACNTMSANAYEIIKNDYDFRIYPILQISSKVISQLNYSRIGVFATQATVNAKAYSKNLTLNNPNIVTKEVACPDWVDFVEQRKLDTTDVQSDINLKMDEMLKFNPDKIILGCTHYPCMLKHLPNKDLCINPAEIFVDYVISDLKINNMLNAISENVTKKFYVTANPDMFINNADLFYNLNQRPIIVDVEKKHPVNV